MTPEEFDIEVTRARTEAYQEALRFLDEKYGRRVARAELRVSKLEEQLRDLGVDPVQ